MLTARGWWFLVVVLLQVILGATLFAQWTVTPAVIGLALLGWFLWEWAAFVAGVRAAVPRLRVERHLSQGGREVPMVWPGLPFEVRVSVAHDGEYALPFAAVDDRLPVAAELVEGAAGSPVAAGPFAAETPFEVAYSLRATAAGVLRFEGVRVRASDLQGFFYHRAFVRDPVEYLILPPLADDEGHRRADKRFNTLPPPGIHRLRRPGSGSELLDLRDYQPGDPPKMIAWKASARRDRLITKEYESDVPVRCVLFVDASDSARLGPPGGTPVARAAAVAAAVAQAAAANRDLVGLTTFDATSADATAPARTRLHLVRLMRQLAAVSALQPSTAGVNAVDMARAAYPVAKELYPDLLDRWVNATPLGRSWRPLLDRWWGWAVAAVIGLSPLLTLNREWLRWAVRAAESVRFKVGWPPLDFLILLTLVGTMISLPGVVAGLVWLGYGASGMLAPQRPRLMRRKQLAALFALQDRAGPGAVEHLIHDDDAFADRAGRFLADHHVRYPVPLYDADGRYRFRCEGKATVLATALVRAVGRARDNELFVILADLADLGDDVDPVARAVRVARARHHQVLVVVPWQNDPPPAPAVAENEPAEPPTPPPPPGLRSRIGRARDWRGRRERKDAARVVERLPVAHDLLARQRERAYDDLRRTLTEAGAVVVRATDGDPVRLVLDRLDRLRGVRSRR